MAHKYRRKHWHVCTGLNRMIDFFLRDPAALRLFLFANVEGRGEFETRNAVRRWTVRRDARSNRGLRGVVSVTSLAIGFFKGPGPPLAVYAPFQLKSPKAATCGPPQHFQSDSCCHHTAKGRRPGKSPMTCGQRTAQSTLVPQRTISI